MAYRLTFGGETWIGPDACSFGAYGGYGSIGRANIDAVLEDAGDNRIRLTGSEFEELREYAQTKRKPSRRWGAFDDLLELVRQLRHRPDAILVEFDHGECVLIRQGWDHGGDVLRALEDYPCLDDERVSQVEVQWEEEAWCDWLRSDLSRFLGRCGRGWLMNYFDALDDDTAFELYRKAMETSNTYPVAEHNGVHVDVDSVGPELLILLRERYRAEREKVVRAALEAYHDGQYDLIEGALPDPEGIVKAAAREFNARFA